MADVHLRLLGPLEVWDGTASRKISGTKERTVLVLLALHADHPVSVDAIADALWGDDPPPSAVKSIPVLVTRLRKMLSAAPAVPMDITRVGDAYRLSPPVGAIDVTMAEELVRAADLAAAAGELDQAAQSLARAEGLWRGPSLADVRDEPFALTDTQRLDELRMRVLEERLEIDLRRGRHDAVIADLEAACAAHPLRERLWAMRMLALHRAGRSSEALLAYRTARELLIEEVGLDPSEELRELEAAILRDDPALRTAVQRRLPEGEVSFLLTDITGSTRLWERAGDAMAVALIRHDEIVRDVVAQSGGVMLKSRGEGDSTFCVFDDPVRATAAAVHLQKAMLEEPWPPGASLRVRMAVHTGRPELRDGDYYGPVVNRASRLRAAGHGGQVLLSAATAALVRHDLPDGVSLRDLGLRRLKDLLEPEHVFQAEHRDLPDRFPPLATLDVRPNNLPLQPTAFVGRDDTAAVLSGLVRQPDVRVVTLTGPGGIGKTRLALRVAADVIDDFEDGVWFVPLAAVQTSDAVPGAVATALEAHPELGEPLVEAIVRSIGDRRLLLVLDNFEHVMDAADMVAALCSRCPGLTVLVTSREWLHLRAEHAVEVPPLDRPTAVTLFIDRARAVRIDADQWLDEDAVADVCRTLDGLPLAIELVAARLRSMTFEELVAQLDAVLEVAADGPRDQPARQRTLRDTIAWSIGLLSTPERSALIALSVFQGGWTLAAAADVVADGDNERAAVLLASLADKSLITQAEDGRYTMLETIRVTAAEFLEAAPEEAARVTRAHFRYWTREAEEWSAAAGGLQESQFTDFSRADPSELADLDNRRAALAYDADANEELPLLAIRFALLICPFDRREALERIDAAAAAAAGESAYWLAVCRIMVLWELGRWADVEQEASRLAPLAARTHARGLPWILHYVGIAAWRLGRLADADRALEEAMERSDPADRDLRALILHNRGLVAMSRDDFGAASHWFEQVLEAVPSDDVLASVVHLRLGGLALERGRIQEALKWLASALESPASMMMTRAMAANELTRALIAAGDVSGALEVAERVVSDVQNRSTAEQISASAALGRARLATGDLRGAEEVLLEGEAVAARSLEADHRRELARLLGRVRRLGGETTGAHAVLTALLSKALPLSEVEARCELALVDWQRGNRADAWRRLTGLLGELAEAGLDSGAAKVCDCLADLAASSGGVELAATLLGAAESFRLAAGIEARLPDTPGDDAAAAIAAVPSADVERARDAGLALAPLDLISLLERSGPEE